MKKLITLIGVALALSVPVFADNEIYFTAIDGSYTANQMHIDITSSDDGCYFYIKQNSTVGQVVVISETSGNHFSYSGTLSNGGSDSGSNIAINTTFGDYYIGYGPPTVQPADLSALTTSGNAVIIPANTTNAEIQQLFADYLANPPSPTPAVPSKFTVPCGNVLYFKVDREQDVTFTAVMPVLSSLLGTPTGAWNSGIQYGPAAALPSSGTTFPILSQDPINFAKTVSNQNLLGQTKNAISTKHCIAGQYYALYLPYHYGGWLALGSSHVYPDGSTSGGIVGANVTVSGSFAEIKVYPLTEKANGDLLTGSVTLDSGSDDGFASYFNGEISDTGTVTWLDQNGDISSPSVGGTSYVPEDVSTESIIDQIKNILSSIVSEIKNLFSFGYEAVNTLVGLMRDFVSVFQQLYEWLPSEVYSALISAIIVAITIGVFKVFL